FVAMVPVDERMAVDLALLVEDQVRRRIPVGQRRGVLINLEGGTGLTPLSIRNDVVLAADRLVVVVRATNHGEHLAGVGVDDLGGTVVDVSCLQVGPVDVAGDGLLGDLLYVVGER